MSDAGDCCAYCRFWRRKRPEDIAGQCHRFPPIERHNWPKTQPAEWCGEFKASRNQPLWQKGIEAVTRKSLPQMGADLTRRLGLGQ